MSKGLSTTRSSYNISVKTRAGYKHIPVHQEIYIYIKQLEAYIQHPELSKLKEVYNGRFS